MGSDSVGDHGENRCRFWVSHRPSEWPILPMDYLGWLLMTKRSAHIIIHVMGMPTFLCVSLCHHGYIGILIGLAGMGYRNAIIHVVSGPLSNVKTLDV